MSFNLQSSKKLFIFLGKSLFSLLEALIFAILPKPRKNVAGEIVLITGAGSGVGRLLALRFARLGSVLVLWDINKNGNEETRKMAREAGATRVHAYTCDCSRKEEVYRVADQVKKEVGDVSILINNAGIVTGKNFLDCPDELMEKTFDVNFKAHLWTYKAFLPAMIANDHGHLVCISSSAGLVGVNGLADRIFLSSDTRLSHPQLILETSVFVFPTIISRVKGLSELQLYLMTPMTLESALDFSSHSPVSSL
ncbi:epidermal retinol dehydrogenase 2 isoform X2 [Sapajus apella]|uniref:Epidermal retinol dehydrogenase 2 isoform X2 n=1 Tax=Sapajus apella TaxID=9515 RepID=A0A6J3JCY8_SAPAP|nr:epidermal retinol dehydrogenase 2 isoform X2 [Sapajus apella]